MSLALLGRERGIDARLAHDGDRVVFPIIGRKGSNWIKYRGRN
jgi:hypothetical protein